MFSSYKRENVAESNNIISPFLFFMSGTELDNLRRGADGDLVKLVTPPPVDGGGDFKVELDFSSTPLEILARDIRQFIELTYSKCSYDLVATMNLLQNETRQFAEKIFDELGSQGAAFDFINGLYPEGEPVLERFKGLLSQAVARIAETRRSIAEQLGEQALDPQFVLVQGDGGGHVMAYMNPAARKIFKEVEIDIGSAVCAWVHGPGGFPHAKCVAGCILAGKNTTSQFEIRLEGKFYEVYSFPVIFEDASGGSFRGVGHTLRDVTDRKKIELELKQKIAETQQLLTIIFQMMHAGNNKIMAFQWIPDILKHHLDVFRKLKEVDENLLQKILDVVDSGSSDDPENQAKKAIKKILEVLMKYTDNVAEVLAILRDSFQTTMEVVKDLRKKEPRIQPLRGVVERSPYLTRNIGVEDGYIEIDDNDIKDSDIPNVNFSFYLIQMAFINIMSNAVRAVKKSDKEKKVIKIGLKQEDDQICFYVKNNGPKIPDEIKQKLFSSLDEGGELVTGHAAEGGTGFGLDFVYKVMQEHGGRVECESDDGWTQFRMYFPIPEAQEQTE